MLEAVFKEVKEVFGKAYFLAGLLPASVLLFGWYWISLDADEFMNLLKEWGSSKERLASTTLLTLVKLFVLSLGFFAIRNPILYFFQDLPGAILSSLRKKWSESQLKERDEIENQRKLLLWKITVARWYTKNFDLPTYLPESVKAHTYKGATKASRKARIVIQDVLQKGAAIDLEPKHCEYILTGLCQLWTSLTGASHPKACVDELNQWQALLRLDSRVRDLFQRLDDYVYKQFSAVFEKRNAFPVPRYIKPTVLGNELTALDDYAEQRYGINTATLWARLREVLPGPAKEEVIGAQLNIEILLNLTIVFTALAIIALLLSFVAMYAAAGWDQVGSAFFISLVCLGLAVLLYRAAVYATSAYKEKVISIVDVHVLRLLYVLGFRPKTVEEMRRLYGELKNLFVQEIALDANRELYTPAGLGDDKSPKEQKA